MRQINRKTQINFGRLRSSFLRTPNRIKAVNASNMRLTGSSLDLVKNIPLSPPGTVIAMINE
jgi:hypothetical protein